MPDVEPIIPIGDEVPPEYVVAVHGALRDMSARFKQVPPEAAFSVLASFIVSTCACQDHPMRSLNQLMEAVAEGLEELKTLSPAGVS